MIDEIRRDLDKATAELIESFVKFDKSKAMQLKVGLHAIHNAQKDKAPENKVNLYAVCDYDMLHNLLEDHGIPLNEFEKIPHLIESKQTGPEYLEELSEPLKHALSNLDSNQRSDYEVPTSGMVAVMFNMVQEKVKNALIAGQAGERTLKAIERATTVSHIPAIKEAALRDTLYDYGDKKRPARPYIGNGIDPDYLVSAKATHHLADLFETSLKLHPVARNFESTEKSMHGFNKLAARIFRHAADNLRMTSASDAAEKINALAQHVESAAQLDTDTEQACNAIDSGMQTLREAMQEEGIISEKESADYKELVDKRIDQIKKMEVV